MDLVTFLRARLDEDEALVAGGVFSSARPLYRSNEGEIVIPDGRLLREVEAKRRIIAEHDASEFCERVALSEVLFLLTLPYDQHPDYRPEWRL
jgi:hypothetical protein